MSTGEASCRQDRIALAAASAACVALALLALGWLRPFPHAWGLGLWQYLPLAARGVLAGLLLLLCWRPARDFVVGAAAGARARGAGLPVWAGALALFALFWLLRERELYGDSRILLYAAGLGHRFVFPDIGASFLFRVANVLGHATGAGPLAVTQILVCAAGAGAVLCFAGLGARLAGDRGRGALAAAIVLCGGLARVCFGHVEVYAFVLLCAGAWLWAGCAFLQGRCGATAPALALGLGLWMHASFVFLLPAQLALPWVGPHPGARAPRALAGSLALAAAPAAGFLLLMLASGGHADVLRAASTVLEMAGRSADPEALEWWVRAPWREPGAGTRFTLYSLPHLKFLLNDFYVLAPAALAIVVGCAVAAPRRFAATPEARFLSIAALCMLAYASLVRPVWGPYDWDVFSLPAACWGSLAACLLLDSLRGERLAQLAALLIGAALLLVAIPFVAIGIGPDRDAGPFARPGLDVRPGESDWEAFERKIAPWL